MKISQVKNIRTIQLIFKRDCLKYANPGQPINSSIYAQKHVKNIFASLE